MPPFGLAHNLLSDRHPDTSPPAGGADPDDGQVATWSAALKAWIAADAAGGVTDHGALTGLVPDDDHTQYALLSGRSGGQSLLGGLAASEHLTLQSTAHATRGYVRAQDDLQLLSNIIRDSGGNARLTLATASPHVTLGEEVRIGARLGIGVNPSANVGLACQPPITGTGDMTAMALNPTFYLTSGLGSIYGIMGQATVSQSAGTFSSIVAGLYFTALVSGPGTAVDLYAAWIRAAEQVYTGPASNVWGLKVRSPLLFFSTYPTVVYGVDIEDQGAYANATQDAIGLKIADQTLTSGNKYLIEAGPATPYLRLVGGANPAANESNLSLKLGAALKQITEYDADSAGAGFRALRVPN